MSEDNRKEQEKKEELTEKDLDKASGGGHTPAPADHHEEEFHRQR